MNHDNENLKNLYNLSGGHAYLSTKGWTCTKEFKISYPAAKYEFKLDGQYEQMVETDGFEPPCC